MPAGCEGEGGTCPDLSWYQTDCYWMNMFNACEDTVRQVWTEYYSSSPFFVFFSTCLKTKEILVEAQDTNLTVTHLLACETVSHCCPFGKGIAAQLSAQERSVYQHLGIDRVERRQ